MSLRIRYQYPTGFAGVFHRTTERRHLLRFQQPDVRRFTDDPDCRVPEDTGSFIGRYKVTLASTPTTQFTNGDYVVTVHNTLAGNQVVGELAVVMNTGSDATFIRAIRGRPHCLGATRPEPPVPFLEPTSMRMCRVDRPTREGLSPASPPR